MFINFVELKKSRKSRANSNSNSKLELDVVGNSIRIHTPSRVEPKLPRIDSFCMTTTC